MKRATIKNTTPVTIVSTCWRDHGKSRKSPRVGSRAQRTLSSCSVHPQQGLTEGGQRATPKRCVNSPNPCLPHESAVGSFRGNLSTDTANKRKNEDLKLGEWPQSLGSQSPHSVSPTPARTLRKEFSHQTLPTWSLAGRCEDTRCHPGPRGTSRLCLLEV